MQTHDGGKPNVRPAPYSPPQGPKDQMRQGPGLGGDNYGQCGTQGFYGGSPQTSGRPGLGGTNHGTRGTQK